MENPSPEDLSVSSGSSISMQCKARGIPPPTLVWFHNGNVLTNGDRGRRVQFLSNDTLIQVGLLKSESLIYFGMPTKLIDLSHWVIYFFPIHLKFVLSTFSFFSNTEHVVFNIN